MASVSSQNTFVLSCHLGLEAFKTREWKWKSKKVGGGNGNCEVREKVAQRGTMCSLV